jgi:hypothetical protein
VIDWISEKWTTLTWESILLGLGVFVVSMVLSLVIIAVVMVKIPADYFSSGYNPEFLPNRSWVTRWGAVIGKNLAGLLLVIAGVIMLIGPGPGILSILTGLILMDIPGKRPLEARLIKQPAVLNAINALRERYGKPALVID